MKPWHSTGLKSLTASMNHMLYFTLWCKCIKSYEDGKEIGQVLFKLPESHLSVLLLASLKVPSPKKIHILRKHPGIPLLNEAERGSQGEADSAGVSEFE